MKLINFCNRIIEYSFYGLFLLVPLVFTSATSELFEMNKMWLTWGLTIVIAMAWFTKMVLQKKVYFQKTPLDIPIGLFLLSQVISTIFSLDFHTSLWGYYSRFNGGLLSIVTYIFLYYAFLSNFDSQKLSSVVSRLLAISLISGLIVALWGLPSHFGYDPTCLLFRGTFDVSCWTADFMPKVRIFSTLGQPDWLAAYLAILIPITIAFAIKNPKSSPRGEAGEIRNPKLALTKATAGKQYQKFALPFRSLSVGGFRISIFVLLILFYVDLLYTRARSGFIGIWLSLILFFVAYALIKKINFKSLIINSQLSIAIWILLILTFIMGTPIPQFNGLTMGGISKFIQKVQAPKTISKPIPTAQPAAENNLATTQTIDSGGTESGKIRVNVWTGAINAWKANPIFGTGVETFAFAYYKYKPIGQNLTSEWNFLYNKAHNEYLNYLATTGLFGLGTYLLMIGCFLFISFKQLKTQMSKLKSETQNGKFSALSYNFELCILSFALIASYISILITNFFGFSVVITNVYLFMIPAFYFVLTGCLKNKSGIPTSLKLRGVSMNYKLGNKTSLYQWTGIFFIILASLFMILGLIRFWRADIAFALGYNLDRAGEYQQAYPNLHKAVQLRGSEPVFKDELSLNNAIIAAALVAQKPEDSAVSKQTISVASTLAQEAINTSNEVVSQYQNNPVFWKTRTRLFFALSQVDSRYLSRALDAIEKASMLAPNDANILYNLGVLYGQNNNLDKGIAVMEKTIILKPDYRDAHYGLGLFYHQAGQNEKAIAQMQYILKNLNSKDADALKSFEEWTK